MRSTDRELVHSLRRSHRLGIGVQKEMAKMKVQHPKKKKKKRNILSYSAGPHNPVEEKLPLKKKANEAMKLRGEEKRREERRGEEKRGVQGLSFSHMKSPESSRLTAELGSAGSSHMTHAWESIFQDLGQRRFHKMPHQLSFLSSQHERVASAERSAPKAAGCPHRDKHTIIILEVLDQSPLFFFFCSLVKTI